MERCTIVVHCLQLSSFIRKDFYTKLTGTTVATPRCGGIIPKKVTVMSGGSIPASKVNLRTIRRVNLTMTGFRPALSVMLVVDVHGINTMKRLSDLNRIDINELAQLIRKQKVINVAPLPDRMMVFPQVASA